MVVSRKSFLGMVAGGAVAALTARCAFRSPDPGGRPADGASPPMERLGRGGVIDVATIGEPPTLDAMASTVDLVGCHFAAHLRNALHLRCGLAYRPTAGGSAARHHARRAFLYDYPAGGRALPRRPGDDVPGRGRLIAALDDRRHAGASSSEQGGAGRGGVANGGPDHHVGALRSAVGAAGVQ